MGAGYFEFGEGGEVGQANAVAYPGAFVGYVVEGVGVLPGVLFGFAVVGHPFPSVDVLPLGTEGVKVFVDRGLAHGSPGGAVFAGQPYLVHLVVFVDGFFNGVVLGGPGPEAAGVHFGDVDFGLAVDHPLGQVFSGARALGDADGGADAEPVVFEVGGGAHEVAAVGGVGYRPADDLFYAGVGEGGYALGGVFEPGHEGFEVGWGEVKVEVPVDALGAVGFGACSFVGPNQQAVYFVAVVGRGAGVAYHGHFGGLGGYFGEGFGDEVLVDHRHDGYVQPGHGAQLGAVVAGGVDEVFGHGGALFAVAFPGDFPALVG